MKKLSLIGATALAFLFFAGTTTSCKKKEKGTCYCKYANGEKKSFDYKHLPRSQQQDSCAVKSNNASHFGGSCKLK